MSKKTNKKNIFDSRQKALTKFMLAQKLIIINTKILTSNFQMKKIEKTKKWDVECFRAKNFPTKANSLVSNKSPR